MKIINGQDLLDIENGNYSENLTDSQISIIEKALFAYNIDGDIDDLEAEFVKADLQLDKEWLEYERANQ